MDNNSINETATNKDDDGDTINYVGDIRKQYGASNLKIESLDSLILS